VDSLEDTGRRVGILDLPAWWTATAGQRLPPGAPGGRRRATCRGGLRAEADTGHAETLWTATVTADDGAVAHDEGPEQTR
jgi:hypothetical protein